MIASKVICDDTYSNKSWCVVGQGMFSLREINQMEREMCGYLDWQLNVPHTDLETFTAKVEAEFGSGAQSHPILPNAASKKPSVVIPVPSYQARGVVKASIPTYTQPESDSPANGLESPSNSDTTSPASSSPATPPSNADDAARVVVNGSSIHSIPKAMATGGPVESKMAVDSTIAYASSAVW
jgi:hypothetical protein